MRRLGLIALVCLIALPVLAQSPRQGTSGSRAGADRADFSAPHPELQVMLEMTRDERRNHLKAMDPAERRGLWFQVKRAEYLARTTGAPDLAGDRVAATFGDPVVSKGDGTYDDDPITLAAAQQQGFGAGRGPAGTIQYDSGFPTIGFGGGAIVGNHFDTHTGVPVHTSGTVSTVQALVVPGPANTTSSAGFVLEGPQTSMGGALAIFSTFTVATGVVDSLTFSGIAASFTGNDFMVLFGDFASVYIPVFGTQSHSPGVPQGHHGVVGYTGGMGPNITSTFDFGGALNSFIRASGNIVPVELMSFSVE